jgi:pyruvate,orthophosphate dikinase
MNEGSEATGEGVQPTDDAVTPTSQKPLEVGKVGMKASNLRRMTAIGLTVPAWFVLDTSACGDYLMRRALSPEALEEIKAGVKKLERETRLAFGDERKPLLVSVRSSAAVSMPGMMETILNVGLCDVTVKGLTRMTGNPRFVWDSYRRFVQEYAEVAYGCQSGPFATILGQHLASEAVAAPRDLDAASLKGLVKDYLREFTVQTGVPFPQEPMEQLEGAIRAVFDSWNSAKAREYRAIQDLRGLAGTAAIVQRMVYGNMGATSGSGVAFTRNPATGQNQLYMDFLFNAQGEDIVSGRQSVAASAGLNRVLPGVYAEVQAVRKRLEMEFKDMQDFEFTVQEGKLFVLQTRNGKRTPWAAVQMAAEMVSEGIVDKATALGRLRSYDLDNVQRRVLAQSVKVGDPVGKGVSASDGVAVGQIVFDSESASRYHASHDSPLILVRDAISTEDVSGIALCAGILTRTGGKASHAAVVARQMGKVCVVGCGDLSIDVASRSCDLKGRTLHERDFISLDGTTGAVYAGKVEVVVERPPLLAIVKEWLADGGATSGSGSLD